MCAGNYENQELAFKGQIVVSIDQIFPETFTSRRVSNEALPASLSKRMTLFSGSRIIVEPKIFMFWATGSNGGRDQHKVPSAGQMGIFTPRLGQFPFLHERNMGGVHIHISLIQQGISAEEHVQGLPCIEENSRLQGDNSGWLGWVL